MPAFMARQGDVLIIEHDAGIPAECAALTRGRDGVVLADGEATGHRHRILSRDATLYEHPSGERFLRVGTSTALLHEEHDPIPVPPGTYRVVRQREYHPDQIAYVAD
jgi:hypothetical protein